MSNADSVCACAVMKVGGKPTGSRNWNPDCPVHPWSDDLQAQADRAVEWQRRAAEARRQSGRPWADIKAGRPDTPERRAAYEAERERITGEQKGSLEDNDE